MKKEPKITDEVKDNVIWRERVKKEIRDLKINENFNE